MKSNINKTRYIMTSSSTASNMLRSLRKTATPMAQRQLATAPTPSTSALPPLPSLLPAASTSTSQSVPLPSSTPEALRLIRSQSTPSHGRYILARLHARNYLLHPKDVLTLPRMKPAPEVGTVLRLDRVLEVGSRDWVLRAAEGSITTGESSASSSSSPITPSSQQLLSRPNPPTLPSSILSATLTILEHTRSPMEETLHKKRRKGYEKRMRVKGGWTRVRVGDVMLQGE